ncbi:hypothetical protein [Rhizobium tropici]|uniref:hypothetical protein n=1 Tax=Rhizobium tropici TaxID=398 RepID=UPI001FED39E7|nr:hypothetical protein [Rhizobium tropici]
MGRLKPNSKNDKRGCVSAEECDPDCTQAKGIGNQSGQQKHGRENRNTEASIRKIMRLNRGELEISSVFDLRKPLGIFGTSFWHCQYFMRRRVEEGS